MQILKTLNEAAGVALREFKDALTGEGMDRLVAGLEAGLAGVLRAKAMHRDDAGQAWLLQVTPGLHELRALPRADRPASSVSAGN